MEGDPLSSSLAGKTTKYDRPGHRSENFRGGNIWAQIARAFGKKSTRITRINSGIYYTYSTPKYRHRNVKTVACTLWKTKQCALIEITLRRQTPSSV